MSIRSITVQFMGPLSDFMAEPLEISVEPGLNVSELRAQILGEMLQRIPHFPRELFRRSALGTDDRLLKEENTLDDIRVIIVLPPVSGG